MIIAVGLMLYSRMLVQPSVTSKYRERVEVLIREVSMRNDIDTVKETAVAIGEEDASGTQAEQYRLINVYLKRLVETPEHRRWAQYQLGLNAAAFGGLLSAMSTEALRRGDQRHATEFQNQSYFEKKRASETMRILSRSDGPESELAQSWIIASSLSRSIRTYSELEKLGETAAKALNKSPDEQSLRERLGQIAVMKAYARIDQTEADAREAALAGAIEHFSSRKNPSFVALSFLAEALDAKNPEAANAVSSRVAQAFWKLSVPEQRTPEILAAMLSSLVRLGSFSEAQGLMNSRIGALPKQEATETLALAADGFWRRLVCLSEFPVAAGRVSTPARIFDLLIQVDPRSKELIEFLNAAAHGEHMTQVDARIRLALDSEESSMVSRFLASYRAALSKDWQTSRMILQSLAASSPPHLPVVFAAAASSLAETDSSQKPVTLFYQEQLSRIAPHSIQTWLERIAFCLRCDENEKALECLGILREKADDNPNLLETLASIYKRLGEDKAAAELRTRITELNRIKSQTPTEGR